jgi:alpha-1,6-mannosyltransferase
MMKRLVGIVPQGRPEISLAAIALSLCIVTAAGPTLHTRLGDWALIAIFALSSLAAYAASRLGECTDQRNAIVIILIGAAGMRLSLLFIEPTLSTDIYRYIWDGRVQAAGVNPYAHVPVASELALLRDAAIWPLINRADYAVTIYPPVAQALFLGITRVGETVVVMKLGLLFFEGVTVAAIIALIKRLGMSPARIAAYAWHPLPVWEIAGNGHVDAAMIALLMMSLLVFINGRWLLAGVLATLGALIKGTALLSLPVFWRPWDWKLPAVAVATIVVAYLPYLSVGSGVLGFLGTYIEEEGFSEGRGFRLVWLLEQVTGPLPSLVGGLYVGAAALVLASLALAVGFRVDRSEGTAIRSLNWLLIAFLVLSTPHYPWYFLVLAPFLALAPTATAWTLTTASVLLHYVVPGSLVPGYGTRFATFTLATLVALAYDLWSADRKAARPMGETT